MAVGQIREYTSPITEIRPSEVGVNSYKELGDAERINAGIAGRAIGGAVANVGNYLHDREVAQTKDEINKLQTTFALQELNNFDGWDQAASSSDGQDIVASGNSYLEKRFAEIDATVAAATTPEAKAYATKEAVRQKIALTKTVHADASNIAGYTAVSNVEKTVNAKVALVQKNYELLGSTLDTIGETINSAIPTNMDPVARAKLVSEQTLKAQQQLVQYGIQGRINGDNPQSVLDDFAAGKFDDFAKKGFIDPSVYNAIKPAAEQAVKNKVSAAKADAATLKATQRAEYESDAAKLVGTTLLPDGSRSVPGDYFKKVQEWSGRPGVTAADIENLTSYGETILNGKAAKRNDPATVADFTKRLMSTGDDKLTDFEVRKAVIEGKLTADAYGDGMFINAITARDAKVAANPTQARATTDMYNNAFNVFNAPSWGQNGADPTPEQSAEEEKAKQWFAPAYLSKLKSKDNPDGKTEAQLLTPGSPDYIWNTYPGLTPDEKAKLGTFIPKGVPVPGGAATVPAPGGARIVQPPLNPDGTIPLDRVFPATPAPAVKPQALDTTKTGSIPAQSASLKPDPATQLPLPSSWKDVAAVNPTSYTLPAGGAFEDPATSGKLMPGAPTKAAAVKLNNMGAISLVSQNNNWVTQLPGYVGKVARPAAEGGYYAKFATPEAGVHASSVLLEKYGHAGIDTPNEIVRKWSADPAAHAGYARMISKYTGADVNTPLDLTNPAVRKAVLMAQSAVESGMGKPIYREEVFDAGVSMS